MVYTGVIVLEPKQRHSYHGREPETDEEYFEMTVAETDEVIRRAQGVPIHVEHLGEQTRVGHVIEAGYDSQRRVCVRFELDKTKDAEGVRAWIRDGFLRGLSLAHIRETSQPVEISLCFKGARPGTGIIAYDEPSRAETTCAARKQSTPAMVQPSTHQVVQASASMDTSATAQHSSGPGSNLGAYLIPSKKPDAAAAAPGSNLGAYLIPSKKPDAAAAAHLDSSEHDDGQAADPATDAESEQAAMAKILDASGLTEKEKQRVLAGITHNRTVVTQITEHAAKLTRELEAAKAALDAEKQDKDLMSAAQIRIVARMVKSVLGADAMPDALEKRIENVQKDPNGVWNAMLPSVVQASTAAMRFKEDAQRQTEASKTHAMYQQYLRSTGWQPATMQQTAGAVAAAAPASAQSPPVQVVEASHAAAAPRALGYLDSARDDFFKRKSADPYADIPRQPASKPRDSFSEVRRMLGAAVPSVQYSGPAPQ